MRVRVSIRLCVNECACVCLPAVCEFGNCCADITLREGVSKCACALVCMSWCLCVFAIGSYESDSVVGSLSDNECASRDSSPVT